MLVVRKHKRVSFIFCCFKEVSCQIVYFNLGIKTAVIEEEILKSHVELIIQHFCRSITTLPLKLALKG